MTRKRLPITRKFRDVCKEHGYDPAEALVLFRTVAGAKALEYLQAARDGIEHPDMPRANRKKLMAIAVEELAALAKWDLELLPYAYGRPHQTVDQNVSVFQPTIAKEDADV